MKNMHKQWIFVIAQFPLPDPYIEYGSGSRRWFEYGSTRIRNTGVVHFGSDLDPRACQLNVGIKLGQKKLVGTVGTVRYHSKEMYGTTPT